jgi:hypothetical protein
VLTYNLFRHKTDTGLYCAVPEDLPVPTFITKEEWVYLCPISRKVLARYDAAAERSVMAHETFLFHLDKRSPSRESSNDVRALHIGA